MTLSSTTLNLPSTNGSSLGKRNSKDSTCLVGRLRSLKTSMSLPTFPTLTLLTPDITRTPKKPKSKKPGPGTAKAESTAGPSKLSQSTTKREDSNAPIALLGSDDEDGSAKAGQKRKRFSYVVENGKKRKIINVNDFHPELQQAIDELKVHIAKGTCTLLGVDFSY